VALDVFATNPALLYVPNLSLNSHTLAENDGPPSWFIVGFMVCN
jgi:hypothetical protein